MVSSMNRPWLKEGVTIVIRGHAWAGDCSLSRQLSSVHGQPVLPGGGGGSSAKEGQRMTPAHVQGVRLNHTIFAREESPAMR
jgi:hypothetical protein